MAKANNNLQIFPSLSTMVSQGKISKKRWDRGGLFFRVE